MNIIIIIINYDVLPIMQRWNISLVIITSTPWVHESCQCTDYSMSHQPV